MTTTAGIMNPRGDLDEPNFTPVSPADDARTILVNNVSWGGVLAGVVAGLVTQLVLNLVGIGIGASTLNPMTGDNPSASGFSIGAGIWWAVSGIIAAFVGGYIASRLSGRPKSSTGGWHGLTSWALTTLVIFYLLSTAVGSLIGGAFSTVSSAIGGVGHAVTSAAQTAAPALTQGTDPVGAMQQALSAPAANDPGNMKDATTALAKALATGDDAQVADAREKVAQAMAKSQNIPIDQARSRVASYEQQYRDKAAAVKQQAAEAADTAAKSVVPRSSSRQLGSDPWRHRGVVRRQGRHRGPDRHGTVHPQRARRSEKTTRRDVIDDPGRLDRRLSAADYKPAATHHGARSFGLGAQSSNPALRSTPWQSRPSPPSSTPAITPRAPPKPYGRLASRRPM